ncbi:MAG: hypothetical protein PVI91_14335 [Gammaproteobacteria bacterium]|jgi:hypothetical protein
MTNTRKPGRKPTGPAPRPKADSGGKTTTKRESTATTAPANTASRKAAAGGASKPAPATAAPASAAPVGQSHPDPYQWGPRVWPD